MSKSIIIKAERHSYKYVPVQVSIEGLEISNTGSLGLKDRASGEVTPAQVLSTAEGTFLCWIIDDLEIGQSKEYDIVTDAPVSAAGVEFVENDGTQVEFHIGNKLFTSYHYAGKGMVRPYLYPVIGPGGKCVTRSYPMAEVPGETNDHKHHRSMWVAHGDINGADDWSEEEGCARQEHRQFIEMISGPVFGRIRVLNDWVDNKGKKLMEEERTITIYNLPQEGRMVDLGVVFRATEGDVKFGDTKEGGIAAVRVATTMDGDKGGLISNSFGGVTEAENWGKPAHWCDYSGPVDGRTVGIAIFDNPGNFRYPTRWHVRNYGLFAANPFALSDYANDPNIDGSHVVKSGELFPFAYRIFIHDGDVEVGNVGEQYHGYINPPTIEIK